MHCLPFHSLNRQYSVPGSVFICGTPDSILEDSAPGTEPHNSVLQFNQTELFIIVLQITLLLFFLCITMRTLS